MPTRLAAVTLVTLIALGAAALGRAALGPPMPARLQAQEEPAACRWRELAVQLPPRIHAAGVFDAVDHRLYYYGGLDPGGSSSAALTAIDFSDPDIEQARLVAAPIDGQQPEPRWGHSGVFVPTDPAPVIYWIAGQRGGRFEPTATPITPMPQRTPTPRPT